MARRSVTLIAAAAILAAGCGSTSGSTRSAKGKLDVASTVAPVTDIVRQVVGDRVHLVGLIPEGVDSHTFEPSPSTVKSLARADVLFMDGLHLEGSTLSQARANMPKGAPVVQLGDLTVSPPDYAFDSTFPREKGDPNPHVWMDPLFARRWSEIVRDTMVARDPADADYYRANQARFATALERLDAAVTASVGSIPPAQRKLLTYHDSFAYFARRYGMEVIGAVQPSDFSEPSPREVQALIEQVRGQRLPAIFGSEVFPSTVLEQVADATGATYVDKLRDDELPGRPGDPNHTYLGMMVSDAAVMTRSLGGDPAPLDAVPTASTWTA